MDLRTMCKNWIMGICIVFNRRKSSEDIESGPATPVSPDDVVEEEDESKVDEADKAVSGFSATYGSLLFGGPASVLFVFTPAQGHLEGSSVAWFPHDVSLAANFVAMSLAFVLLFYTLGNPAPSRRATRNKTRIAGCSLFWFMVGVFSRVYLALPSSYQDPVIVLTGGGLVISAIFLLYPRGSTRNPRRKSKSSQVNRPQVYSGKSATEGTDITQGSMPVKGDGGLPTPTGDPSAQSSQGNNHPSSRVEKQAIELAKAIKPYEEMIIEEPYDKEKAIKLLNEVPGIKRDSDQWLFAESLLHDCITRKFFIENIGNPSSRGNWIRWKYKNSMQPLNEVVVSNDEVGEGSLSMMRTQMPTWETGQQLQARKKLEK